MVRRSGKAAPIGGRAKFIGMGDYDSDVYKLELGTILDYMPSSCSHSWLRATFTGDTQPRANYLSYPPDT